MQKSYKTIALIATEILAFGLSALAPALALALDLIVVSSRYKGASCNGGSVAFVNASNDVDRSKAIINSMYPLLTNVQRETSGLEVFFSYNRPITEAFTALSVTFKDPYNVRKSVTAKLCFRNSKTGELITASKKLSEFDEVSLPAPFRSPWTTAEVKAKELGFKKENSLVLNKVSYIFEGPGQISFSTSSPQNDDQGNTLVFLSDRSKYFQIDLEKGTCEDLRNCSK